MASGFYTWHTGTLADGKITNQFEPSAASWQDVMDDAGTLSMTLDLGDTRTRALRPYVTAEPCRCFLAVSYTDPTGTETFLAGGPIWTHNYDSSTRQLVVGGAGVWSYYDHRKLLPVLAPGVSPATALSSYSSLWWGTIAKRLVQLAHTHTGGALPIVFQSDEAGTAAQDYPGYQMDWVGQALRNITAVDNPPEIQFVPRRKAADTRYLEWLMRVGTVAQPLLYQAGADLQWDQAAVKGSISKVTVQRDATNMGERAWVQGSGTDVGALFGRADDNTLISLGYPLLEVDESGHENEIDQPTLDALATAKLTRSQRPVETWSFDVRRDGMTTKDGRRVGPLVGAYAVGDWAQANLEGDPYLPDGIHRGRIVQKSGDLSPTVRVEFAPTTGSA